MTKSFRLPDLGEGIHEGEIIEVLVSVGDRVKEGQSFLVIETDKATVDIPSPFTAMVKEVKVKAGDLVRVGAELMVFGNGEVPEPSTDMAPPFMGARPESASEEDAPFVGARSPSGTRAGMQPGVTATPGPAPKRRDGPVPASPATRRLARELGVELSQVVGSGQAGLVTAEDVRAFAQGIRQAAASSVLSLTGDAVPPEAPTKPEGRIDAQAGPIEAPGLSANRPQEVPTGTAVVPPLPDFGRWGPVERVPVRSVRRATAAHMALAWSQIPHVNHQEVVDITRLESFRRQHAPEVEALGGKLTMTVFALKAVVAALKAFPRFNSSLDVNAQEMVLKRYYHLGVAVDTERGLVVPVLRDVDRKSLTELAVELHQLAQRTRAGEAGLAELQGGTFTVTNIGVLGGTGFAPIINYPQVAILGMGRARLQPMVLGDLESYEIVPRLMMPLVLAFDHRVLDGADAARFVRMITEALEDPDKLWLRI